MRFNRHIGVLTVFCITLAFTGSLATGQQPKTTRTTTATGETVETRELRGTVVFVDGNSLVVKMDSGEIRHIVTSDDQKVLIAGKQVAARDLKVGTKLMATVTTTTTSITERTRTVGSGTVWYVAGNTVILTLPNGENRQYKVADDYKFTVNGRPATVFDLRKGMTVAAEKIVEEPRTVVTSNRVVTGELPPAEKTQVAAAPAPRPAPPPAAAAAPARPAAPAPASTPAPEPQAAPALPATLPETSSTLPMLGLAGAFLTMLSLTPRVLGRRR
jgi:hypothetical protein